MKKLKLPKFHWAKLLSIFFFVLLLGSYIKIFAIASPYAPGEILDPECAPGEENCIVLIGGGGGSSPWLTSGSNVYYNDGNVGIGTDTPTSQLDIKLGTNISYDQTFSEDDRMGDSLDDATYSGTYTGGVVPNWIYVYIDSEGTTDTFSYDDDNRDCPTVSNVPITGSAQLICDGISITFASVTGHSLYDEWDYEISSSLTSTNPVLNISDGINNYFTVNAVVSDSIFIGVDAGFGATGANDSNFLGNGAGYGATGAIASNFLGIEAGYEATDAVNSNFLGNGAGYGATSASSSNFFGMGAGQDAVSAAYSNFLGMSAGAGASLAGNSNFLGQSAGYGATSASNSNFIGWVAGNGATSASNSNFLGNGAGSLAVSASNSNFLGQYAGRSATSSEYSNFLGYQAGDGATSAPYSNFLGINAGNHALRASDSNFIGGFAGSFATDAHNSNFFGWVAGQNARNAYGSTFLGYSSGEDATNAANSIFIGANSGHEDLVDNTASYNNISTFADTSILIGLYTSTGSYSHKNSIALGAYATNTAQNQFMIGSITRPINTTIWNTAGGTTCTLVSTGLTCTSDQNFKTNIHTLGDNTDFYEQLKTINEQDINTEDMTTLEKVISIVPVKYDWKASKDEEYYFNPDINPSNIGFIAQDLELYFPELVAVDVNGNKSVNYANMTPILTEAIRELNLKVKDLSSLDVTNATSLGYLIKSFLLDQSVLIHELTVNKLNIDGEVCVDDTCITKEQFKQMIITASNIDDSSGGDTEIPPVVTPPVNNPDGTLTPEEIEAQRLADLETERLAKEAEDKAIADKAEADRIEAERIAAELEAQKKAEEGV